MYLLGTRKRLKENGWWTEMEALTVVTGSEVIGTMGSRKVMMGQNQKFTTAPLPTSR